MAGHTNVAFRSLVRELGGCGLVCSELISSHVLSHHPESRQTRELFDWRKEESPFAVQLFGSDPQEMAEAAKIVEIFGASMVDINLGCWVPKVAKKGCGAAMLREPLRAAALVEAVCQAVKVPVSAKIRLGYQENDNTAIPFAEAAAAAGACLLTVHGRYAQQGFQGQSDHRIAGRIKAIVGDRLKVIANGDITCVHSAERVLRETSCDGLMLGRGALRKPWIFRELAEKLWNKTFARETFRAWQVARRHVQLSRLLIQKPEKVIVRELRGQLLTYRLGADEDQETTERGGNEDLIRKLLVKVAHFSDLDDFFQQVEDILEPQTLGKKGAS